MNTEILERAIKREATPEDCVALLSRVDELEAQACVHRKLIARAVTLLKGDPEDRATVEREFNETLKEYLREGL